MNVQVPIETSAAQSSSTSDVTSSALADATADTAADDSSSSSSSSNDNVRSGELIQSEKDAIHNIFLEEMKVRSDSRDRKMLIAAKHCVIATRHRC